MVPIWLGLITPYLVPGVSSAQTTCTYYTWLDIIQEWYAEPVRFVEHMMFVEHRFVFVIYARGALSVSSMRDELWQSTAYPWFGIPYHTSPALSCSKTLTFLQTPAMRFWKIGCGVNNDHGKKNDRIMDPFFTLRAAAAIIKVGNCRHTHVNNMN